MNKLPERIRIKDIARLADVSVGTVDRVLHGRTGVSEASRKRICLSACCHSTRKAITGPMWNWG